METNQPCTDPWSMSHLFSNLMSSSAIALIQWSKGRSVLDGQWACDVTERLCTLSGRTSTGFSHDRFRARNTPPTQQPLSETIPRNYSIAFTTGGTEGPRIRRIIRTPGEPGSDSAAPTSLRLVARLGPTVRSCGYGLGF